jgi:hypothetical protein
MIVNVTHVVSLVHPSKGPQQSVEAPVRLICKYHLVEKSAYIPRRAMRTVAPSSELKRVSDANSLVTTPHDRVGSSPEAVAVTIVEEQHQRSPLPALWPAEEAVG